MKTNSPRVVRIVGCKNGSCPQIVEHSDGRVFVQGATVSSLEVKNRPGTNESIVEIPRSLLEEWAAGRK